MTKTVIFTIAVLVGLLVFGFGINDVYGPTKADLVEGIAVKAIPDWVDQSFRWYAEGQIPQSDLLNSMKYLLDHNIMHLSDKAAKEMHDLRAENKKLHHEMAQYRETDLDYTTRSAKMPGHSPEWSDAMPSDPGMMHKDPAMMRSDQPMMHKDPAMMRIDPTMIREKDAINHLRKAYDLDPNLQTKVVQYDKHHDKWIDVLSIDLEKSTANPDILNPDVLNPDVLNPNAHHSRKMLSAMHQGDAYTKEVIGELVHKGRTDKTSWEGAISDIKKHRIGDHTMQEMIVTVPPPSSADSVVDDLQGIVVLCSIAMDKEIGILSNELEYLQELKTSAESVDRDWKAKKLSDIDQRIDSMTVGLEVLEEKMATAGDDAQLANIDLQNSLQKMQQTIQMLSNISKSLHDTQMATIKNIG